MENAMFAERVRQIDARIRDLGGEIASEVRLNVDGQTATWQRSDYTATLVFHSGESPERLSLELLTGTTTHPDSETLGIDDPDVVELIARPAAALLSGAVTE
jgi:hypothetical protein